MTTYDVIYADPPWRFKPMFATARYDNNQENHYSTMSLDDICGLRVPAAKDSVLYLWATSPHLEQAFRVLNAWGFTYKTSAVWAKTSTAGTGYWFRIHHELLLVASRGKWPAPKPKARQASVYHLPRGQRHSEKPALVREHIESYWPDARRLELFARQRHEGWDCWGNEVGNDVEIGGAA